MKNKIIIILLASVALIFGISCISADTEAAEAMTFEYGGCTYEVDEASVSTDNPFAYLIGYDNVTADVKIPSAHTISVVIEDNPAIDKECGIVIDPSKFSKDMSGFKESSVIKTLVFEDGSKHVQLMDDSRRPVGIFSGCKNLETVKFGTSTPEIIPQKCFYKCSNINSVTFSEGLIEISSRAFYECSSITSLIFKDGLKTIGSGAFFRCTSLTEVIFNEGLNEIGNTAFEYTNIGGTLSFPDSVTNIGQLCFEADLERSDRNVITSVNLGKGMTQVRQGAFKGCAITEITIPDSLTDLSRAGVGTPVGGNSFNSVHYTFGDSLEKFVISETHPTYSVVDGVLFDKNKTTLLAYPSAKAGDYTVPASVTVLGNGCFSGCAGLKNVTIPETLTTIPFGTFSFSSVTAVNLENIMTYSTNAFEHCESLGSVTFNPALKDLSQKGIFNGCKNLEIVSLPDSITKIGDLVFQDCSKLNISELPGALTSLGSHAFDGTGIQRMTVGAMTWGEGDVPLTVKSYAFWNCDELTEMNIGNIKYSGFGSTYIANGVNLESINYAPQFNLWAQSGSIQTSVDGKIWWSCLQGCKDETITVPSDVRIGNKAFDSCLNLKHVVFEDRTDLVKLTQTFWGCSNLESIVFPNMAMMNSNILYGCDNLKYLSFPDSGDYTPESVVSSGTPDRMFAGIDTPLKPQASDIQGYIWAGNGDGTFYRIGQTVNSAASSDWTSYVPVDVTVYGDIRFSGMVNLSGTMTISEGVTANGKLCNGVNELTFDKYMPVLGDSIVSCDKALILTDAADFEGSVADVSRVIDMDINCFYNDGKGIIIDVSAFTNVPDGQVLVQYSVYTVIDNDVFLNPFKVSAVDVKGNSTLYTPVGEKMLSCVVSYSYEFNGETLCTPVSESAFAMPADFIQIEAPAAVELTLGDTVVKNGDYISHGTYNAKIVASDGLRYELNGIEISTIESISYFGQVLQIVPVPLS